MEIMTKSRSTVTQRDCIFSVTHREYINLVHNEYLLINSSS